VVQTIGMFSGGN